MSRPGRQPQSFDMPTNPPSLTVVGCNHHSTPLEIREKLALTSERLSGLRHRLAEDPNLSESFVLHTCNRLELYAVGDAAKSSLRQHLREATGFDPEALDRHAYLLEGQPAVGHLFEVASGLDSQLLGETEILGQVKVAYAEASGDKTVGKVLHRVLQKTFQAAKWTRTHTAIGQGQVSLGNVTVELAERIFGRLENARTLVVGSGEVGREAVRALRSRGASTIAVSSRRLENAKALAQEVGGETIPFESWNEKLRFVDIAVFATAAPASILARETVVRLMDQRGNQPLFIVDLAVPRDVDATVAELDSVFLYNFQDLAEIANANRAIREAEVSRCRRILAEKSSQLWAKLSS